MRRPMLLVPLAVAACSPPASDAGNASATNAMTEAHAGSTRTMPASSAAAREARALVVRYFALIDARDYAAARRLWGHDGADAGGDAKAFAATFTRYSVYRSTVGAPTDIHVTDGRQYVNVAVKVHAQVARTGKILDQEGPVMLMRPADSGSGDAGPAGWSIWGTDIRVPH